MSEALNELPQREWPHLKRTNGCINFFVYLQDGTRMPWQIADTHPNRLFVDWLQVHDSPFTGNAAQVAEATKNRAQSAAQQIPQP